MYVECEATLGDASTPSGSWLLMEQAGITGLMSVTYESIDRALTVVCVCVRSHSNKTPGGYF